MPQLSGRGEIKGLDRHHTKGEFQRRKRAVGQDLKVGYKPLRTLLIVGVTVPKA